MNNENDIVADLMLLLQKHRLTAGVLLVPIGNDGTSCFRINASEELAARIMENVAKNLAIGNFESVNLEKN